MDLDPSLLSQAQMEDWSCSKLLNATETILPLTSHQQPYPRVSNSQSTI